MCFGGQGMDLIRRVSFTSSAGDIVCNHASAAIPSVSMNAAVLALSVLLLLHVSEAQIRNSEKARNTTRRKEQPYEYWENVPQKQSITWGEFVQYPHQVPRTKNYIRSSALKALQRHSSDNTSSCQEHTLQDVFVTTWKSRKVKDLCEANANSKISCYDSSIGKSRYCIFENAMMDFRKMRRRKADAKHPATRSWERGFISADCGDMAPDDIGYLSLYKPDIEGREQAICDYVFNETVLAYSHENARSYSAM
ncbi:hypothetical protein B484DRAFT_439696, partial [Ochromonadaceae sp. CCMP2298]